MTAWDFCAAVTAGGRSRRFGSDKAAAVLAGRPLLEWVTLSLERAPCRLVLGRAAPPGWTPLPDARPGEGPLPALLGALHASPRPWLAYAGVDAPGLNAAHWELLAAARRPGALAVCIRSEGGRQPLGALYHRGLIPALSEAVAEGERRLRAALVLAAPAVVELSPAEWGAVAPLAAHNVNTPADLAALERLWAGG